MMFMSDLSRKCNGTAKEHSTKDEDTSEPEHSRALRDPGTENETAPAVYGWAKGSNELFRGIGCSGDRHCRCGWVGTRVLGHC